MNVFLIHAQRNSNTGPFHRTLSPKAFRKERQRLPGTDKDRLLTLATGTPIDYSL
jgi:hypothetical protein